MRVSMIPHILLDTLNVALPVSLPQTVVTGYEAKPDAVISLPSGFRFPSSFQAKGGTLKIGLPV